MENRELFKEMVISGFIGQFGIMMDDLEINWSGVWTLDDISVRG